MATIVRAEAIADAPDGPGRARARLVDETAGVEAMTLQRLTLAPGAEGPELTGGTRERFVYVVRGTGTAGELALEAETVVWIEDGDRLLLRAGDEGLVLLLAEAR